jgi:hypothetical protein
VKPEEEESDCNKKRTRGTIMKKSTTIAVVVFSVLLVAVILDQGGMSERGITRISFTTIDSAKINRVKISGNNPVELTKKDGVWFLSDNHQADPNAIDRLIEAIPKINSSDLVTSDSSRYSDLEVDDEKGSRLIAYAGSTPLAEFVVGKAASGGTHIRVDDEVYKVKKVYPNIFSKEAASWYKLKLFEAEFDKISRVDVKLADNAPYSIAKKEDKWSLVDQSVLPEGFRFDHNSARSLVSNLINLRAQKIVLEDVSQEKTGLGKGHDAFVFVDQAGKSHELLLGKVSENKDDNEAVYAQIAGSKDVFLLRKYSVKNLRKKATDLRDMKMIDLDPDKVKQLTIINEGKKLILAKQGAEWKIEKSDEKIPDDFEFDSNMVMQRLRSIANAKGQELADKKSPAAKTGLSRPSSSLAATLEDGSQVTMAFGNSTKIDTRELIYATGNIDQETYLVNKSTKSGLTRGLDSFKKREAPPMGGGGMPNIDPQTLANMPPEIRAQIQKQMQQQMQQQQMMKAMQAQRKKSQ